MQNTENYDLPLYELDDMGNLSDGYNDAMRKIDAALHQQKEDLADSFPVDTAQIENGAVTTNKLATASVTSEKLADGAVETQDIADGAVTGAKIANGTITNEMLAESFEFEIQDNSITNSKLADNSVTLSKINVDSIDTTPTLGSSNLISSNAVAEALEDVETKPVKTLTKYKDGIFLAFGDSITKGRYVNPDQAWPVIAGNILQTANTYNFAVNSAAFTRSGDLKVLTQVQNAANDSRFNNEEVSLIAIGAGFNDANTEAATYAQVNTELQTLLTLCINTFPNADIVVLDFPMGNMPINGMGKASGSTPGNNNTTGPQVHAGIFNACNNVSQPIRCITSACTWGQGHDSWFISTGQSPYGDSVNADVTHPNVNGNAHYADYFVQSLIYGDYKPNWQSSTLSGDNISNALTNQQSTVKCIDGMIIFKGVFSCTATGSSPIFISLPSWCAFSSASFTPLSATLLNKDNSFTSTRLLGECIVNPSGQTQPKYALRVSPSTTWEPVSQIIIEANCMPLGGW